QFLTLCRSDDVIGAFRTMFAAAGQQVSACEAFYRLGPDKLVHQVALYLHAADAAGSLAIPSAEKAADQFLSLFTGLAHIRSLLGLGRPSSEEDQALIQANVALFLRAYRP
ncbi:MAG: TetR/AcrR family transcriptional regulator C-terminal domain-containing protein, partial [Magnetococcales bacterium]|nr:TetR/AcrR family transcriptional regulator C-terminal domain-containing protein [Magnetococcales bacterium]